MLLQNENVTNYPPIIVISGCTASGKNDLAISLAKEFEGVIVNADSKQVYKELMIGTARPIPDKIIDDHYIVGGIRHYLYGHISIFDDHSLYHYQKECLQLIHTLSTPVFLVGGTGLYIDAVVKNYSLEGSTDPNREELESLSLLELQEMVGNELNDLNNSDKNNKRRLIRVIERQKTKRNESTANQPLRHLYLMKTKDLKQLEKDIVTRTTLMMENGLIKEAEAYKKEIIEDHPKLQIIGYKEFKEYFEGTINLEQVTDLITLHTRQYAKRQRTWFRNKADVINVTDHKSARSHVANFLTSTS